MILIAFLALALMLVASLPIAAAVWRLTDGCRWQRHLAAMTLATIPLLSVTAVGIYLSIESLIGKELSGATQAPALFAVAVNLCAVAMLRMIVRRAELVPIRVKKQR